MLQYIGRGLDRFGTRMRNLGYVLSNPCYAKVRSAKGSRELYKLLNRRWFYSPDIRGVVDVGANEGQSIRAIQALLPGVETYAFEPNPACASYLRSLDWEGAHIEVCAVACGSQEATLPLTVFKGDSGLSSLLDKTQALMDHCGGITVEEVIQVPVVRLDKAMQQCGVNRGPLMVKIDTQGYELEVLKGATHIMPNTAIVVCEVNLMPFYSEQCMFDALVAFMATQRFKLFDMGKVVRDGRTMRAAWVDMVFRNESW